MEIWQVILMSLGGNVALLAAVSWLAKSLITEWLKQYGADRKILYSKLHEKRTEAISTIYIELTEYFSICQFFVIKSQHVDEEVKWTP